ADLRFGVGDGLHGHRTAVLGADRAGVLRRRQCAGLPAVRPRPGPRAGVVESVCPLLRVGIPGRPIAVRAGQRRPGRHRPGRWTTRTGPGGQLRFHHGRYRGRTRPDRPGRGADDLPAAGDPGRVGRLVHPRYLRQTPRHRSVDHSRTAGVHRHRWRHEPHPGNRAHHPLLVLWRFLPAGQLHARRAAAAHLPRRPTTRTHHTRPTPHPSGLRHHRTHHPPGLLAVIVPSGQPGGESCPGRGRRIVGRVGQYGLRCVVSGGALACASLAMAVLGTVASPLPNRGLAAPSAVAMAAPAALPDVPEPAAAPAASDAASSNGPAARTVTIPVQIPALATPPGGPQLAYAAWAGRLARVTGIPARALEAYANAHAVMAASRPSCHLTWVTLAGIAAVESQHGTIGGRTLLP